jgi:hypothetical protein
MTSHSTTSPVIGSMMTSTQSAATTINVLDISRNLAADVRSVAPIIGGVVSGIVLCCLILGVAIYFVCRKRRDAVADSKKMTMNNNDMASALDDVAGECMC